MSDSLLGQLQTPEARRAVAEAVLVLLQRWALHDTKRAELLGVADMREIVVSGMLPEQPEVLERAGHLLAIGRALARLHADAATELWWLGSACQAFGGLAPLTLMLGGVQGIRRVRAFLESQLQSAQ